MSLRTPILTLIGLLPGCCACCCAWAGAAQSAIASGAANAIVARMFTLPREGAPTRFMSDESALARFDPLIQSWVSCGVQRRSLRGLGATAFARFRCH